MSSNTTASSTGFERRAGAARLPSRPGRPLPGGAVRGSRRGLGAGGPAHRARQRDGRRVRRTARAGRGGPAGEFETLSAGAQELMQLVEDGGRRRTRARRGRGAVRQGRRGDRSPHPAGRGARRRRGPAGRGARTGPSECWTRHAAAPAEILGQARAEAGRRARRGRARRSTRCGRMWTATSPRSTRSTASGWTPWSTSSPSARPGSTAGWPG